MIRQDPFMSKSCRKLITIHLEQTRFRERINYKVKNYKVNKLYLKHYGYEKPNIDKKSDVTSR